MRNDRQHQSNDTQPLMPVWFRRGLIVVATLLLCSCRDMGTTAYGQAVESVTTYQSCPCEAGNCESGACAVCQPGNVVGPPDEYLCDGGDQASAAGVLQDDSLVGIEQEDTVAHYTTRDGRVIVSPSSRVCIYAPRFGSVRQVVHPMGAEQRLFVDAVGDTFTPAEADLAQPASAALLNVSLQERAGQAPPSLFRGRQQAGQGIMRLMPAETRGLVAPYANLSLMHIGQIVMSEGAIIANHSLAAITWTGDQEAQVTLDTKGASALFAVKQPGLIYQTNEPNCPKLRLVKLASTDAAHPGDEVSFTLRFDNIGDAPINHVVIVDNLTARLAYIEESAKSSVEADFSTARNEVGSLLLRWELAEPVAAGEGGVLTFRTRVR
jgi:uncharacterized repeat protein (TIGR01451 family)